MPNAVTLDDKYLLESGRVYLTGTQALVRLPMMQRQRDLAAGLNTGGYISGYRGSPLGGFDQALWQAKRFIKKNHIEFQPGVNEDLAATALWGTQQIHLYPGARYDGVFGMWYGKGPGVDRSGDVLKHANYAGTSPARRHRGAGRRRPHGQVVDDGPPERARLHGRRHSGDPSRQRPGVSRFRPACLRDVALLGPVGRLQGAERDRRFLGLGPCRSASGRDPYTDRLRPAARRRAHPLARRLAGPGAPRHHGEAAGGAGLLARQQARPADDGPARRALRHRHGRQVLPRRPPGARRARHRRSRGRAAGPGRLQGRPGVAARDRRARSPSPRASARSW